MNLFAYIVNIHHFIAKKFHLVSDFEFMEVWFWRRKKNTWFRKSGRKVCENTISQWCSVWILQSECFSILLCPYKIIWTLIKFCRSSRSSFSCAFDWRTEVVNYHDILMKCCYIRGKNSKWAGHKLWCEFLRINFLF